MKRWRIFDITRPVFEDEKEVEAKTAKEALKKVILLKDGQYIKQVKYNSARFVVYNPDTRVVKKRLFDICV